MVPDRTASADIRIFEDSREERRDVTATLTAREDRDREFPPAARTARQLSA
jgi:hypothetical protein